MAGQYTKRLIFIIQLKKELAYIAITEKQLTNSWIKITYFFFYSTYKRRKLLEIVIPNIKHFLAQNYKICELDEKLATSVTNSTMRVRHEELFSQILGFEIE